MVILHHRLVQDGGQGGHLGRGSHNEVYQVESHLNERHLDWVTLIGITWIGVSLMNEGHLGIIQLDRGHLEGLPCVQSRGRV